MKLTEAYEIKNQKIKARSKMKILHASKLLLTKTTFEKVAIRQIIEAEKEKNKVIYKLWPEAQRLIEEAEDFNNKQMFK